MRARSLNILELRGLVKRFDGFTAVAGVDLLVRAGELHAIIGPNGAGKTTLFNLISGDLRPSAGTVHWKGADITRLPPYRRVHLGIGRSYQLTNLFPSLSVVENVRLAVQAHLVRPTGGAPRSPVLALRRAAAYCEITDRAWSILAWTGLTDRGNLAAQALSHGDQRKLELAILLACEPELLLLDEPTAGMSHEEIPDMLDLIQKLRTDQNLTIVLVEHKMDIVLGLSDRITVLHFGKTIASGTPGQIMADATVQDAYLGRVGFDVT